jgi:hypothetical protein
VGMKKQKVESVFLRRMWRFQNNNDSAKMRAQHTL